jgi:hypothetical protein
LRAAFLEAATGKQIKTFDWPTDDASADIFPRYDGGFLYFSTERLVLYSPEWTPVKELVLPELQDSRSFLTGIAESPSGRIIEVRIARDRSPVCIRILIGTLTGAEEPCMTSSGRFSVSDDAHAQSDFNDAIKIVDAVRSGQSPNAAAIAQIHTKIMIREHFTDATLLCDQNEISGCNIPQFMSNDAIVVYCFTGLSLLTRKSESNDSSFGRIFGMDKTWIDLSGGMVRSSPNGQRFAVVFNNPPENLDTLGQMFHLALTPDHIDVYDLPAGGYVFTLKNKKKQFQKISGLALSPGGEKLCVDSGGVLQMYALPTANEAKAVAH